MNRKLQEELINMKEQLGKIGDQRRDDLDRIHKTSVFNQERLEDMLKEALEIKKNNSK